MDAENRLKRDAAMRGKAEGAVQARCGQCQMADQLTFWWTWAGFQLWCERCQVNVMHADVLDGTAAPRWVSTWPADPEEAIYRK